MDLKELRSTLKLAEDTSEEDILAAVAKLVNDDKDGDDGDNYIDPGDPYGRTCRERHGQIYRVEDAVNILDHPNGTLNWQPMPRNYRPEETI